MKILLAVLAALFAFAQAEDRATTFVIEKYPAELEGANLVGVILGWGLFVIFMIYTLGRIVVEERVRHRVYGSNLEKAKRKDFDNFEDPQDVMRRK